MRTPDSVWRRGVLTAVFVAVLAAERRRRRPAVWSASSRTKRVSRSKAPRCRSKIPDASPRNFTATSDDRGRFAVIGLKAGEWSLVAQAPGFQAGGRAVAGACHHAVGAGTDAAESAAGARGRARHRRRQGSAVRPAVRRSAVRAQQWDQAIASYKSILAKAPALSVVNLQVGAAYRNKKDYDNALAAYNDLLKADPNSDKARVGVGQTYIEKGDLAAAASALNQGAQQSANKEIFFTLGEVEAARGNTDAAVQWYQKASADDPNWGKPLLKLGLTSLKKGDNADAAAKMQRVLAVDPTSPEAAQARTVMEQLK